MAIEVERLIATLEARLDKFEKSLARASGLADKNFKKVEDRGSLMESRLAKLGVAGFKGFAIGAAAAVASVFSVQSAIQGAKDAMQEFGRIADQSMAAGLDPETFQELAYQAQQGGVEFEAFSGALATFAKNAGLAVVGKGKMTTALKALNPELLKSIQAATTQEERLRLVADAIQEAGSASERAAISTAVFGDAGSELAAVFSGGAAAIDATARKARELGLVVSGELIARADQLGDEFDTASKVLDLQFKQALIELAPFLVSTIGFVGDLAAAARGLADAFSAVENKSTAVLEGRLAVLKELLASQGTDITTADGQIVPANPMAQSIGGADATALKQELAQIEAILAARKELAQVTAPAADETATRTEAAAATVKQGEAVKALIADLMFEQQTVGLSAEQQQIMNTLRQAGVEATSQQGQQIRALIESINAQREAQEQLKETTEAYNNIAKQAGSAIKAAFDDGKLEGQELLDILIKVVAQLALMSLANLVPGGNIFTSFLGGILGGFSAGTPNTGGSKGQVRGVVHGQEAVIPLPSGGRVPVEVRMPGGGAAAGQPTRIVLEVQEGAAFSTRILEVAGPQSVAISGSGISQYDRALPSRAAEQDARFR